MNDCNEGFQIFIDLSVKNQITQRENPTSRCVKDFCFFLCYNVYKYLDQIAMICWKGAVPCRTSLMELKPVDS